MGKNNEQLLKIAESHLGQGGAKFRAYCGLPSGAAYCNAFVDYVANEGGDAKLYFDGKKMTYCPTSIQWCYKNLADIPPYLAMPMDIIYFDWEPNGTPNHIGFVRSRKDCENIYTIEGNTSKVNSKGQVVATGVVANKERTVKYVQAIFRPEFEGKFDTSKPLIVDGFFGYNSIAMLQRVLMITQTGILDKKTVKALQVLVGVTADGSWGVKTSKAVQKLIGVKQDGFFGAESVKALQKWLNKQVFTDSSSTTKPTTPTTSEAKTYDGTFPNITVKETKEVSNANILLDEAKKLAWPKGTDEKKYAFKGGKATPAFDKAFDKVFPKHDNWGKGPKTGASCDVASATPMRSSGLDKKMPRGRDEIRTYEPSASAKITRKVYHNCTPYSVSKPGDMICYDKNKDGSSGHVDIVGKDGLYEAQYQKTYFHLNKSKSKIKKSMPRVVVFRAKPTKKTVTREYLQKGDKGAEVGKLQKFLNWYGNYGLEIDKEFGDKTEAAVKDFQKKEGTKDVTGRFGTESLALAKAVRK